MSENRVQLLMLAVPTVALAVLAVRFGGPITGLDSLRAPLLVAAVLALLVAGLWGWRRSPGRVLVRRTIEVHGHSSDRKAAAMHEAGHVAATRKVGGRVVSAQIWDNGAGLVRADLPEGDPVAAIAVGYAGQYAERSTAGAGSDNRNIRAVLAALPRSERARVHAAGKRLARQVVFWDAGAIRRDARRLDQRGRI
jgi:hypothetical protein